MADTTNLALPYLEAAQSQKHVTHNVALTALDAIVMLSVLDRDLTAPPGGESDGDRYLVGGSATGDWAGQDGNIAAYQDGAYNFYSPQEGWLCYVVDEAVLIVFGGSTWSSMSPVVSDANFKITDDVDPTKIARFECSGIPTGTTRTYTLPDRTSPLAVTGTLTQIFSGTTTFSNATVTVGSSTATATYGFGSGATASGATKTINIGTSGVSGSTTNITIGSTDSAGTITANQPLGVNTTADATNKLAVASEAVLFTNVGNGVQHKLNKAAAGDTASFLFQTNWTGYAEIGLCGDNNFAFKTYDGSNWNTGLTLVSAAKGVPKLPGYATGDLPSASTAGAGAMAWDTTLGKLVVSNGSTWVAQT
jgi:hypothetical protein